MNRKAWHRWMWIVAVALPGPAAAVAPASGGGALAITQSVTGPTEGVVSTLAARQGSPQSTRAALTLDIGGRQIADTGAIPQLAVRDYGTSMPRSQLLAGAKAHLTATTHVWGDYYTRAVSDVLAGTWKSGNVWGGFKEGMIKLAPLNPAIPADVKAQVAKLEGDLKAGTFHAFAGPVKDQDGKERVPAGKTMGDDELGKMDYYVEGVASKLPKK